MILKDLFYSMSSESVAVGDTILYHENKAGVVQVLDFGSYFFHTLFPNHYGSTPDNGGVSVLIQCIAGVVMESLAPAFV